MQTKIYAGELTTQETLELAQNIHSLGLKIDTDPVSYEKVTRLSLDALNEKEEQFLPTLNCTFRLHDDPEHHFWYHVIEVYDKESFMNLFQNNIYPR